MDKINTNFPLKGDSLNVLVWKSWKIFAVLQEFSHFYPFFNDSRPFCTQGALNFRHTATGNGCHITHCIKDTSLWWTLQRSVRNSEVLVGQKKNISHTSMSCWAGKCRDVACIPILTTLVLLCHPYFTLQSSIVFILETTPFYPTCMRKG